VVFLGIFGYSGVYLGILGYSWVNVWTRKKMHIKEIYVIFIHLFDSGILLIIDLNKKKGKRGGG